MDGLIIKKKWLDLIVDGKKTIEIRGSDTNKQNETIYLLESGTHRVVATVVIRDAIWIYFVLCQKKKILLSFIKKNIERP